MITLVRAPATLPPGQRVYAIGDIHGCDAQLANLHEIIAEDLARRPVDQPVLLHIGDYVDRGANTAGVLRRCWVDRQFKACRSSICSATMTRQC